MITDTLNPVMNEDGIIETAVPNKALVPPTPKVEPLKIEAERPPWEDYGALLRSARARSPASRAVIPGAERPPWEDYGALPEQAVTKPPETLPEQAVTKPPETFLGNVKEQWSRGAQSVELDMQAWEAMMGMRSWEEVKAKRDAFKALPPIGENSNLLSKAVQGVAGMLPAIGKGMLQGQAVGLTAAVGAGVAGQLGPQIALPEEIITVPGAYTAGVAVGSFEYWARQGTGQIYADLRDANVSHDTAKWIAPMGGVLYAAIEFAQIDRIVPGLGRKAKEVVKRTLMKRFLEIARNAVKNIAVESLEEGAQQVVTDTTTAVGKYIAGKLKKEDIPDEVKKTALNALDQVYQTIGPMALLQVPGGAVAIKRAVKTNARQGGTNISGIQAKLGAIIQDQTMAGNMDAATTAGRMLKAAKANKLDVLPESHWAAMQRTIIAAATPKPSQIGGSTVVEPTISPEPIPAPAPPPLPLGAPVNGTPGAEMPGAAPVVPETPVLAGTAAKGEAIPAIPAEPRPPPGTPSQEPTGLPPVADAGAGGRVDIPVPAAAEPVTTAPEPPVQQKGKPQSFMAMEDKGQGPQWVEVPDAKPIRVAGDDVTPGLFIRRVKTPSGKDGEYFIVEPRSGRAIGHGITRKEAVAMAVRNLAPPNRAKVIQYTAEWETLNPPKPPAPTAKSSAAIPAPAVAPPAPVVAPVEPAVAPQPPAAKTPEQLTEQRQMLLDIMETRRRNGQPVVKEHRIRLAELDSLLKGETPEAGAVASELVFGHPEATNIGRGKYNHLIPIQVADAASVERFRVRAQQALDGIQTKLSTAEAIVKGTIKGDKKKAKAYLSSQEAVEDSLIRDLLRKETLPELKRLNDVFKGEPGAAPAEAAQGEAPLAPEEPIAPTPKNADEVRPELQQGVRVEFDNLDGKGKQPYVIVTREPFDLKNTLVGEVHLTIRNEATGEQVAVEAADISRVLPPREKVPLKQVAEMYQARVEKTPPPAVVKNPALRAAARKVKGAKITVVKSETDIPDTGVRKSLQGKEAEGVFVTEDGSIYVIEDQVPAGREEAVIAHEAVGHFGVRAELGDATPETLLDIYNKATGKMQDVIAKVAKDYGIDLSTEAGKREATEEALGVLAETRSTDPTTWDKIVSGVRKILRKAGFVQEWSENDIQVLLYKAARRAGKEGAYADNIERIQAAYRGEKAAKGNQTLVASNAVITAPGQGIDSDVRLMVSAYHGTPHTFESEPDAPLGKFKKEKIGTGEGAAAYGWGVAYTAQNKDVAEDYANKLAQNYFTYKGVKLDDFSVEHTAASLLWSWQGDKEGAIDDVRNANYPARGEIMREIRKMDYSQIKKGGNVYHVELDFDPEDCLDWDKPLSEQSEEIQSKIQRAIDDGKLNLMAYESTGEDIYGGLAMPEALGSQQAASEYLASLGIRGIKYADQGSRTPQIARGANEKFNVMANGQLRSFDTEAEAKTFADSVKTFNFVVFNESDIRVVGRNGETLKPSDAMAGETETMLSRKPQADPFLNQEAQEMHGIVQDKRLTEGFPTKAEAPQREAAKRFYDKDPNAALNALSEGKVSPLTSEGSFIWQYTLDQEGKKAAQSGNPRYGARVMGLMLDYMEVGTEMGRAFHTRHDAMLSPRERNELFLNRAFLQPSSRFMETLGTMAVTEREKALESEFERSQQMRFELMMKLGIDIANLDEATLADPRKIAALVRYKQVKDASIGDKVYEYWRNSILSSLGTLLGANPLGNIANTGWDFSIQRSVEALLNLGFKNPEAAQFGELKYVWKHMLGSSRQLGWQNAVQAWSTEQPVLEGTRYDESGAAISDEYGGRIIRVPQRTLLFADELLKGITYRSQIISMAYREAVKDGITDEAAIEARIAAAIANPSQAMIEEATKTARELAFQGKLGTIGQMLLKGKHNKNIFIRNLSRYMFPFVTTPMNIVKQGMAKTPIGSLMMVSKAMHGEYKGNQKQLIRDLAEQVIATATTLALLGMVGGDDDEEPWITGTLAWNSPRGQRDQEQKYRPPQSVRIAGRWYSYARIEPFATSMATIVDLIKAMRSAPEKGIDAASYQAFNSVKQQLKDKTFLSSVGDIIRWADKDQGSKTWSENFAASWVPNMFRQGARAFDPYIRNVNDKGPVGKSILRKMLPIPLLQNPPKRDIWGVAIKKGEGPDWPPATDILYRMVVPVRTQLAITPNNIDRMLFNWNNKVSQKVGEKAWWPELPRMSYKKNGKTIEMTPDEYDKFIQYRGEIARKRLMAQYWRDGKAFNEPTKREVERVRDAFAAAGRHAKARLRRELRITGEIKDE